MTDLFPELTTVVHCKRAEFDVYIGRPSLWGNPFSHESYSSAPVYVRTREDAITCYEQWITGGQQHIHERLGLVRPTLEQIRSLRGKRLGCWCKPQACHGDVLARLAHE